MVEMSKKKIIAIVAAVVVVATALFIVYDLNGKSFDLSDRETRIVVTNSMDGNVHPDAYYHCKDCDAYWLPNNLKTIGNHMDCPHAGCGSANTEILEHSFSIGKIAKDALIMTHKLSASAKNSISVGDVISFEYSNRETIHRVIDIDRDSDGNIVKITTSGDNTTGTEITTDMNKVHGVVVGESEFLGNIVHFAKSSSLMIVLMIIIVIVIITVIRDMYRMSQNDKKGNN